MANPDSRVYRNPILVVDDAPGAVWLIEEALRELKTKNHPIAPHIEPVLALPDYERGLLGEPDVLSLETLLATNTQRFVACFLDCNLGPGGMPRSVSLYRAINPDISRNCLMGD